LLKASTDFSLARRGSAGHGKQHRCCACHGAEDPVRPHRQGVVERPNKLRAARTGDLVDQVFYYDGESLTLHDPHDNYYAMIAAPGTLEAMLDFAREKLDVVAPAGDLLYRMPTTS